MRAGSNYGRPFGDLIIEPAEDLFEALLGIADLVYRNEQSVLQGEYRQEPQCLPNPAARLADPPTLYQALDRFEHAVEPGMALHFTHPVEEFLDTHSLAGALRQFQPDQTHRDGYQPGVDNRDALGIDLTGGLNSRLRGFTNVDPTGAVQLINREEALILDVRENSEVADGLILGAIHIPLGGLKNRLGELEEFKSKPVIVGCRSGHRSSTACGQLKKGGFENVYNLKGGILAWKNAGMPLNKETKSKKKKRK